MPTGLEGFFGLPKGYLDKAKPFSLFQTLAKAPSKSSSVFQQPQTPSQVMGQGQPMMGQSPMSPPLNNGMPMNSARVPPPFPQPLVLPGQPPQMPPPIMPPGPPGPQMGGMGMQPPMMGQGPMQGPPSQGVQGGLPPIPPQLLMLLMRMRGMGGPMGGQSMSQMGGI